MRRFLRGSATVLCIAALVVVAIVIVMPAIFGLQRYVITGGSMTGTIAKGSVIYSRLTPVEQLRVGDIITFFPPGYSQPVTHRIIALEPAADGRLAFRTRGDYNPAADPWKVSLVEPMQARYAFRIPYVGYALAALAIRQVRMLLIGLPALLIAVSLLWSLWRKAGEEIERQDAERRDGGSRSEA